MPTSERPGSGRTDLDVRLGEAVPMEVLGLRQPILRLFDDLHGGLKARKAGKGRRAEGVFQPEGESALSAMDRASAREDEETKVRLAHGLLAGLSPRHRLMVKLHYGIGTEGGKEYSQADIGKRFGITGARVGLVEGIVKRRLAGLVDSCMSLREPDNRDVLVFENTDLNPDSAEFKRLAALPAGELSSMFGGK